MTVAVVDYGAGNLHSVRNAVYLAGADPVTAATPDDVLAADRLILPGVGAAGRALAMLNQSGIAEALYEAVRVKGRPILGICLGMQLLAGKLHEFGEHDGLGWLDGDVVNIRDVEGTGDRRVPHMGWNKTKVDMAVQSPFADICDGKFFYFAHSYTLRTAQQNRIVSWTDCGASLVAAVQFDTVFATQFHPEKSQIPGEKLIAAFLEWAP